MTLEPLLSAPLPIRLHTLAAAAALVVGLVQLTGSKGTRRHRLLGYGWCGLMLIAAASAFYIHKLDVWHGWSPIHLLALYVLIVLPFGLAAARRGNLKRHRAIMTGLFFWGLCVAGALTLWPGRILHGVFWGE